MNAWTRNLRPALVGTLVVTVATGLVYPALVAIPSRLLFREAAGGSIAVRGGHPVGSFLLAQGSTDSGMFHPRPSAAGSGWASDTSSGSNAGPLNRSYIDTVVPGRTAVYRSENGLPPERPVPASAVAASGSGLDPDITLEDALLQAPRVARVRHLDPATLAAHVRASARDAFWQPESLRPVNVLSLNLDLEEGHVR
jgi:K+-transporting ATPase ATPase C chain